MTRGLMERDEWKNLGLDNLNNQAKANDGTESKTKPDTTPATGQKS